MHNCGSLRTEFQKLRPKYTAAHQNWSKSDQLETDNFIDFVYNEKRLINTTSKKLFIIHEVFRCGTSGMDDDLFDMISKTIDDPMAASEGGLDAVDSINLI